nr:NAD(P)/FAD-dependent oxidoreductase [uncultured Ilyobacter sp.]
MKVAVNNIMVSIEKDQEKAIIKEIEKKGIRKNNIKHIEYEKRSIDSRKIKDIKLVYNVSVILNRDLDVSRMSDISLLKETQLPERRPKKNMGKIAIIGTGPAGLFSALRLCEYGYEPMIFERGKKVDERHQSVDLFYNLDQLDEDSNIQFGEGGAGTYSDGKLNTRIKSEYISKVFRELIDHGAQKEIMWDYKPHVGTDVLKDVVKNLREKIISMGGKFYFESKMTDIEVQNGKIKKIEIWDKNKTRESIEVDHLLLCIGHSARDTYQMLHRRGVFMENKAFAVGARIEHPRADIDRMQYGEFANHPLLGAATYNMAYNNKTEGRGIFSFCMCPGGEIVNAASENRGTLVNGMSYSTRDGEFSNSALVVAVKENEFGEELFSGMKFQKELEKKAYDTISNYGAVYQRAEDFLKNQKSTMQIESSYKMRLESHNLNDFFPALCRLNLATK